MGDDIRWRKGNLLGTGAFSSVFLGLNVDTGELMAVKEVIISDKKSLVENVMKEVALLSKLDHKHIVKYMGTEVTGSNLHIFMEYVPGGSVEALLAKFGNFPEELCRVFTKQILEGLVYLHEVNVMHRDIKGGNILITNDGIVKLADFGASRDIEALTGESVMATVTGTPLWMAPEVVLEKGYCHKADVYSTGATVMEMLTGSPPNSNITHFAALIRHWDNGNLVEIPDHLSPDARDFLGRSLHIDPDERASAPELLLHPFCDVCIDNKTPSLHGQTLDDLGKEVVAVKKEAQREYGCISSDDDEPFSPITTEPPVLPPPVMETEPAKQPPFSFVVADCSAQSMQRTCAAIKDAWEDFPGATHFEITPIGTVEAAEELLQRAEGAPVNVFVISEAFPPLPLQGFEHSISGMGMAVAVRKRKAFSRARVAFTTAGQFRLPSVFRTVLGDVDTWRAPVAKATVVRTILEYVGND